MIFGLLGAALACDHPLDMAALAQQLDQAKGPIDNLLACVRSPIDVSTAQKINTIQVPFAAAHPLGRRYWIPAHPTSGWVQINGLYGDGWWSDQAVILQYLDDAGNVQQSLYWWPQDPLPDWLGTLPKTDHIQAHLLPEIGWGALKGDFSGGSAALSLGIIRTGTLGFSGMVGMDSLWASAPSWTLGAWMAAQIRLEKGPLSLALGPDWHISLAHRDTLNVQERGWFYGPGGRLTLEGHWQTHQGPSLSGGAWTDKTQVWPWLRAGWWIAW